MRFWLNRLMNRTKNQAVPYLITALMLCVTSLAYSADGWEDVPCDWPPCPGDPGPGDPFNVFLNTTDIYMKSGIAIGGILLLYFAFLFLFKSMVKKGQSPSKSFTVVFSLLLVSIYLVVFFCFSEYTVVNEYKQDITLSEYFGKLNLPLMLSVTVGWIVFSLILSILLRGNAANEN